MTLFLQRCFDGLFNGAIYASLALALVLLFAATGLLNFALGEIGLVGAYSTLVFATGAVTAEVAIFQPPLRFSDWAARLPGHPFPLPVAIVLGVVVASVLALVIERIVIRRLDGKPDFVQINATIALLIIGAAVVTELWGGLPRRFPALFPSDPDDQFLLGGARLRYSTLGAWALLAAMALLLLVLLRKTRVGLAFRAVTSNREAAMLSGVPIGRTLAIGWVVATAIGTVSAVLVATSTILRPGVMVNVLVLSFASATIGGLDSPRGAVVGGMIVGLTQSLVPGYLGVPSQLAVVPPFVVMTLLLVFRPRGLFGSAQVVRA